MKVFVTGSTGLAGSHAVRELIAQGHDIRFLLRDLQFAKKFFSQFDIEIKDYVIADMTQTEVIKEALSGCHAVLHTAATINSDSLDSDKVLQNNFKGLKAVVGSAVELGIRHIVYLSSSCILLNPDETVINESSALTQSKGSYSYTKLICERYVRELQMKGAPIQVAYPGGILGPHDPRLSKSNRALVAFLTKIFPITASGLQIVDVRDLAIALRLMLERPCPPTPDDARMVIAGHFYYWKELHRTLEQISNYRLRTAVIPGLLLRLAGRCCDLAKTIAPLPLPLTKESSYMATRWIPCSSQKACAELGITFRNGNTTLRETIEWLKTTGHLL